MMANPATNAAAPKRLAVFPFPARRGKVRGVALPQSVGMKLFLLIFCSICLCVAAGGIASYTIAERIIESKVSAAGEQTIKQTGEKLDLVLRNFQEITDQLSTDLVLQEQMDSLLADRVSSYTVFQVYAKLTERLRTYVMNNPMITDSYFIPVNESVKKSLAATSSSVIGTSSILEEQVTQEPWFRQTVEAGGSPVWIPLTPTTAESASNTSQAGDTIGIARLLRSTANNADVFVLLMEIRLSDVAGQFGSVSLGDGSSLAVVDGKGNFVYAADRTQLGQPAPSFMHAQASGANGGSLTRDGDWLIFNQPLTLNDWRLIGTVSVNELLKDTRLISLTAWLAGGVAALLAVGIGLFAARLVAYPLSRLRNLMNDGKNGNLTVRSDIRSRDEIGQLAGSFNEMMAHITSLVRQTAVSAEYVLKTAGQLTEAAKKTATSAKEISLATEEIAAGASNLALEAEQGNDLTTDMGQHLQLVVEARSDMSVSALDAVQASRRGTSYMEEMIGKTVRTEQIVQAMYGNVERLLERAGSIQSVLDVLEQFAKQTNMLSLNASIEASRAGAAGKGFRVIADEIRALAERSRLSIDSIAETTRAIQTEIGDTVRTLADIHPLFQEQTTSVKEAGRIFAAVRQEMEQLTGRLETVTGAIGLLSQSQYKLSETIGSVSAVADQASASTEQVASASGGQLAVGQELVMLSDRLEDVSGQLKESLARFTV